MLEFHQPTLSDRDWITAAYAASGKQNCEYTFATCFLWGADSQVCQFGPFAVQRFVRPHTVCYLFPAGPDNPKLLHQCLLELIQDGAETGLPVSFLGMNQAQAQLLRRLFPDLFTVRPSLDHFDYLYAIDRLAELKGKKLQAKRNHINRFLDAYPDWSVREIGPDTLPACREFLDRWYRQRQASGDDQDFSREARALSRAMDHYEALGLSGLALLAGDQMAAFTMGSFITPQVFDVSFEKADPDIPGAYALINREFARFLRDRFPNMTFLNREDDMGLPGLRKAKESYGPDILLEKYIAEMEVHIL